MTERATPIPNLSEVSKKSARFRIVKYQEKYIPQERTWRFFWTKIKRVTTHSKKETLGYTTFDEAQKIILDEVEARQRHRKYWTEEVKAYYTGTGALSI